MRVLLYGGTFDPPHYGHLNNLQAAVQRVRPDEIVVMPAGVPPHKRATATPAFLRLEMCKAFSALTQNGPSAPVLTISDWEIQQALQGRRNYTVLTLEMLAQDRPQADLYLTIGSDMLLSFDAWVRWQDILRLAKLVVVSRNIGDDAALHAKAKQLDPTGARILFAPAETLPMASSELRARLAAGELCTEELPEIVRSIIQREGLYRGEKEVREYGPKTGKGPCAQPTE